MKTQVKEHQTGKQAKNTSSNKELKTDLPISEKDEVKKAEQHTQKGLKDHL